MVIIMSKFKAFPEINISLTDLKYLIKSEKNYRNIQKLKVLYYIKLNKVKTRKELSELILIERHTVSNWLKKYEKEGLEKYLKINYSTGRKSIFPEKVVLELKKILDNEEEGFDSYINIQKWLKSQHNLDIAYETVHKFVRYNKKAKLKAPRPYNIKKTNKK